MAIARQLQKNPAAKGGADGASVSAANVTVATAGKTPPATSSDMRRATDDPGARVTYRHA